MAEFVKLELKNDGLGKPAWQECDSIAVVGYSRCNTYNSPNGGTHYYHNVSVITEAGDTILCQFKSDSDTPIENGDHQVQCMVRINPNNGNKSYTFRKATAAPNSSGSKTLRSSEFRTPEQIMRGEALTAACRICKSTDEIWQTLALFESWIENGQITPF